MLNETEHLSTGADFLDQLLNGGYENDILTTIYGPSGAGKTTLCLLPMIRMAGQGKKIIFIDTEGGFAVERIKQITAHYQEVLHSSIFFRPTSFEEQEQLFHKLKSFINEKIGLIVVDSISMLYRLELGKREDIQRINASLGEQVALLMGLASNFHIPVLITNQVYADFNEKDKVSMVGGDLLKYSSKCLIELKRNNSHRELHLRKHRSIAEGKLTDFQIVNEGIKENR